MDFDAKGIVTAHVHLAFLSSSSPNRIEFRMLDWAWKDICMQIQQAGKRKRETRHSSKKGLQAATLAVKRLAELPPFPLGRQAALVNGTNCTNSGYPRGCAFPQNSVRWLFSNTSPNGDHNPITIAITSSASMSMRRFPSADLHKLDEHAHEPRGAHFHQIDTGAIAGVEKQRQPEEDELRE